MNSKLFIIGALATLLVGCSTDMQNLTPTAIQRNNSGLYPVEVIVNRAGRGVDNDSIQTSLVVGQQEFPMLRPDIRSNRYEYLLSVPDNVRDVYYYFKVNYSLDYPTSWGKGKAQVFPETAPEQTFRLRVVGNPPPVTAPGAAEAAPAIENKPLAANVSVRPTPVAVVRGGATDVNIVIPSAAPAVTGLLLTVQTDNPKSLRVPAKGIVPSEATRGTIHVEGLAPGRGNIVIDIEQLGRVLVPFEVFEKK